MNVNVLIVTSHTGGRHVRVMDQLSIEQMRDFALLWDRLKSQGHIRDYLLTSCSYSGVAEVSEWGKTFEPATYADIFTQDGAA